MAPTNAQPMHLISSHLPPRSLLQLRSIEQSLSKRYTSCSYYDTSCSTHRTIIIIIIIAVVVLKLLILFLIFRRHQKRKQMREQARQATMGQVVYNESQPVGAETRYGPVGMQDKEYENGNVEVAPPPPYMPQRPERAVTPEPHRMT